MSPAPGEVVAGHERRPQDGSPLRLEADVCIVGTGAGGAAAGRVLALAGARVLFLEEGRAFRPEQFIPKPSVAYRNLYQERNTRVMEGKSFIPLPGGRGVGGSTLVNSGICFRAPERVRRRWMSFGLEWAAPGELDEIYSEIEARIGVAKTDPTQARGNNLIFRKGVQVLAERDPAAFGLPPGEVAPGTVPGDFISRNAPGCVGCGVCQLGCPTGGKASMDLTLIPDAVERGADVYTGCRVERIEQERGHCRGVAGTLLGPDDSPAGRFEVRAAKTVVCGSAVGTPMLLWRSGLCNRSGQVGRNLHVHPGTGTVAFFDEEIRVWDGVTQGYFVEMEDEGITIETFSATPETYYTVARRNVGPDLRKMNRMASCGAMIADRSAGTVRPLPDGRAEIQYSLIGEDRQRLVDSLRFICKVYAAAGATELYSGVIGEPLVRTIDEALRPLDADVPLHALNVYASHPQGTCQMGVDPDESVVRPDGRTHDVDGLYIADGSLFPEALGVNPQLTIMSMATWIGRRIAKAG